MKKKMRTIAAALTMAMAAGGAVARSTEIYEPPSILWASAVAPSSEQVRNRIISAAQSLGWHVSKDEPGQIELHFDKQGKHQVDIEIQYDPMGYKIKYLRSVNLNFSQKDGSREIHPNYNRWIRNLMKSIGSV